MIAALDVTMERGGRAVLDGVSVHAHGGEVVALVGPNGAGKSTLLSVLAGLLPVQRGAVCLDGTPLSRFGAAALGRRRARMSQRVSVAFGLFVHEVVAMGRFAHGLRLDDDARVRRCLAAVGASALYDRPFATMSGGEQQRVQLARVLCQLDGTDGGVLLLDEPTSAQDLAHQQVVLGAARGAARAGHAVVVVLHELGQAAQVADRLVVLADGRVVADGPPADTLTEPVIAEAFGVSARVRWLDGRVHVHPTTISCPVETSCS
jgi:iron complex transport system ATP-binding protein